MTGSITVSERSWVRKKWGTTNRISCEEHEAREDFKYILLRFVVFVAYPIRRPPLLCYYQPFNFQTKSNFRNTTMVMSFAKATTEAGLPAVASAIEKAQKYLLDLQYPEGYWWAELEANVTLTAEYVM